MHKSIITSDKLVGIMTLKEWKLENKKLAVYKGKYQKRMIAFSKEIMTTRAKLIKTSKAILLDKRYAFSIPMTWSIYRDDKMLDKRVHQNEYITTDRMERVLRRFSDWVLYRTRWFKASKYQKVGPEFALMGNNKILWTTADRSDNYERQMFLGVDKWVGRTKFLKNYKYGLFITGTMNGKIQASVCKDFN